MNFHLVAADLSHVEVLSALHDDGFDEGWSAASFDTTLRMPGSYGFIAMRLDDDEPLGFALFRAGGGEAEVLTIATRSGQRGRGVATALMNKGLALARDLGAEQMVLEVADDNTAAVHLYTKLLFAQTGRRPGYYSRPSGSRADALIMVHKFPSSEP